MPIIFATYPLIAGINNANLIFNIVFFITIMSLVIQGTTVGYMAGKLRMVDDSEPAAPVSYTHLLDAPYLTQRNPNLSAHDPVDFRLDALLSLLDRQTGHGDRTDAGNADACLLYTSRCV